jgi:hypothetical protein
MLGLEHTNQFSGLQNKGFSRSRELKLGLLKIHLKCTTVNCYYLELLLCDKELFLKCADLADHEQWNSGSRFSGWSSTVVPHPQINGWGKESGVDALTGRVSEPCATGDTVNAPGRFHFPSSEVAMPRF